MSCEKHDLVMLESKQMCYLVYVVEVGELLVAVRVGKVLQHFIAVEKSTYKIVFPEYHFQTR